MAQIFRTLILAVSVAAASGALNSPWQSSAAACPGCKNAIETDSLRPQAYMYSILFMLAMPATVFTGFGIAFYRLSRKAAKQHEALLHAAGEAPDSDSVEF